MKGIKMQTIILDLLNDYGYVAIFLLMMMENIFPPIPSEVILTFGGFLSVYGSLNFYWVIIFATLGAVLGSLCLYAVGFLIGKDRLEQIIDSKLGRILHLKREDVQKADDWFARYDWQVVFFGRCIPLVRSLISIPAGLAKMNGYVFILLTSLGTLIWNCILITLGKMAGNAWQDILIYVDSYAHLILGVLLIMGSIGLLYFVKKRFFN